MLVTTLPSAEKVRPAQGRHRNLRWSDKKVIAAWHGPLTLAQIAHRSHCGARSTISRIWREAKDIGLLPPGDRPHFPQVRRTVAPPAAPERDLIDVASVRPVTGWPPVITEILRLLASHGQDEQFEAMHCVLATIVVSRSPVHQRVLTADLIRLHVLAMLRRHHLGEHRLPTISYHSDRSDAAGAAPFEDAIALPTSR